MRAEVFLASVAEPDAKDLRNLFALLFAEAFVKGEPLFSFAAAGGVAMRVPKASGRADAAASFRNQRGAGQRVGALFCLHKRENGPRSRADPQ